MAHLRRDEAAPKMGTRWSFVCPGALMASETNTEILRFAQNDEHYWQWLDDRHRHTVDDRIRHGQMVR
ncbi:hypothetical protein [Edaphobacter modestus]|uniref:Uncharacterized protein n=1 Tax=Edaphobacter modestus TaxID=388466 RepID=A0A4Q7YVW2_9BACT|nr:hypothetical protein [Edaphobacter modestus]RZU41798.1 hypothetical protein BDD14_3335 [Edaphobacter modestus]